MRISAFFALLFLGLSLFGTPDATAQTNAVTVEQIEYLTPNLDSLAKAFVSLGFQIVSEKPVQFDRQQYEVLVSSGPTIHLKATLFKDTSNWLVKAAGTYGTHVTSVMLRVPSLTMLQHRFDSLQVAYDTIGNAIALRGPEPLDVIFVDSNFVVPPKRVAVPDTSRMFPSRVSWLVLSASPEEEEVMRKVWAALGLHRSHEGCCDYWLIGPPEDRVATRFEIPSPETPDLHYEGSWLSIEPGGVVFAY